MFTSNPDTAYKRCGLCHATWPSLTAFLRDPSVIIEGYQASFADPAGSLFLFTHDCGTTLSLRADLLTNLSEHPIHFIRMTSSSSCPGYCLNDRSLAPCKNECDMRWARDIIQLLRKRSFPPNMEELLGDIPESGSARA